MFLLYKDFVERRKELLSKVSEKLAVGEAADELLVFFYQIDLMLL